MAVKFPEDNQEASRVVATTIAGQEDRLLKAKGLGKCRKVPVGVKIQSLLAGFGILRESDVEQPLATALADKFSTGGSMAPGEIISLEAIGTLIRTEESLSESMRREMTGNLRQVLDRFDRISLQAFCMKYIRQETGGIEALKGESGHVETILEAAQIMDPNRKSDRQQPARDDQMSIPALSVVVGGVLGMGVAAAFEWGTLSQGFFLGVIGFLLLALPLRLIATR
ncbi:MAG: hypothetical protein GY722_27430 [bacterium]|nr:hypothetical protein [bacterium]